MVFSGTTQTDFMKLYTVPDRKKEEFINFAGNDFLSIRQDLISYIKSVYPLDYENFSESDLGVMLIELVAYMGAVVSLKSDMLANENYLRTVKSRENLKKLLELIGVDMKAPVAAGAGAKLTSRTAATGLGPFTFTAGNRVFGILAEEDGAPVNYTLYKIVNNAIEDIQGSEATVVLNESEAVDPSVPDVYTNVAFLEGSLTVQKGTFDAAEGNKRISLTQSPIIEGSVQVYVEAGTDDPATGVYTQVDRIYSASGATDRVFQVVYDDVYAATIIFGDNAVGISPPPTATFTTSYRVGGGTRGNIRQNAINVTLTANAGAGGTLEFISENRTAATGGGDAETSEHAKKYSPLTFKRQDRVVTLEDFIAIGNTFRSSQGTIGKTTAAVRDAYSSANIIDLYTLEKASNLHLQKASPTFKKELLDQIEPKKMLTDDVVVCDGLIRTLDLVVTVRIDKNLEPNRSEIEAEVASIILDFFNVDNMDFKKPFVASELNRKIFDSPRVRYSTVDNVPEVTSVEFNEIIQLNNFTINTVVV